MPTVYKFIRKLKKSEEGNPAHYLSRIPDKAGWRKVYKPYGKDGSRSGRGYYYEKS